ncbi:MAG: four helix bundle protein [Caldilinea sp.]|uniref:four helix bundle protein n=1 Tax=Caldilinea sp. TaxID=2293560 RepID=UPI002D0BBAA6|nr:four helix bundle protein [Caldilinea sp.]HRA67495.1 four helix bundle protein [Caldilinea sp.]
MGDLTDLRIFQQAEQLSGSVWRVASGWDYFAKRTVGEQLVRAVDSIGANIAEAFGRYHYGEKLQLLYYARGSLFETRFWLRQAYVRRLLDASAVGEIKEQLEPLPIGLNLFIKSIREQRNEPPSKANALVKEVEEVREAYLADAKIAQSLNRTISSAPETSLFTEEEIQWLTNFANAS